MPDIIGEEASRPCSLIDARRKRDLDRFVELDDAVVGGARFRERLALLEEKEDRWILRPNSPSSSNLRTSATDIVIVLSSLRPLLVAEAKKEIGSSTLPSQGHMTDCRSSFKGRH